MHWGYCNWDPFGSEASLSLADRHTAPSSKATLLHTVYILHMDEPLIIVATEVGDGVYPLFPIAISPLWHGSWSYCCPLQKFYYNIEYCFQAISSQTLSGFSINTASKAGLMHGNSFIGMPAASSNISNGHSQSKSKLFGWQQQQQNHEHSSNT